MVKLLRIFVIAAAFVAASAPAVAQMPCAPRETLVGQIAARYSEQQEAIGLTPQGGLLELFVSERGSWTILMSSPDGTSCVAAVGENWEWVRRDTGPQTNF